ncbi:MAG: YbaB/EbfC DNA-binding family [Thermoanaerobacteraceae bacterium]|jgi:DNA-binding protein YbaB|uniref:YbaB/EbfC family DNA-binding protein n=1 Tax=Biomaibacter acetigenes TaxID=2316383 RepID=A0A3G2R843_9FIRM|nr:YbaB/EbfC family nucleoid-associated protein [Biomaibacter acetigenes]AYO30967.1 YbaB/EbfC family DNA-binding protein [Biomaibacter acetigenes]MDK2877763.1 YbaB/EbfC DNA-binding family [Thermoanaerobacteraceae bacterium]MDN5311059.1 YbaB/EbfC DNA-binding family [Thermoanaerobacteraceae bacterium]RKL61300.1 YbaB/EbfC family DNA-binding protein [Thermoanaerobacteraceae bacterium SP2]
MLGDMEKMVKMFQDEIKHLKDELRNTHFTGESSDGKVIVTFNGLEELVDVNFYMEEMDPEVKKSLEQGTTQAVSRALIKVKDHLKQKFSDTGMFGGI